MNWRSSPPRGGWSLGYEPPERPGTTIQAQGITYQRVLAHIRQWRVNNGLPPNDDQVFDYANRLWCQRDPGRCTQGAPTPVLPAGSGRRTLTPADYGRACWLFLNTFGVSFNPILWNYAITQVQHLLNPNNAQNNGSGCMTCAGHFKEFTDKYPPEKVVTEEQAAVWAWLAHNDANFYSGKAHKPNFRQCVVMFGWKPLSDEEFELVKAGLAK